jgi:aryl-alcohol dehydrogenase-like predicted oxidoreductase
VTINKFIFGTAKLGLIDYGHSSDEPHSSSEIILQKAQESGIDILDTSPRYGNAESLIGDYHARNDKTFRICTKIDKLTPNSSITEKSIFNSVTNSLKKTNTNIIDTLYLHQHDLEIISDYSIIRSLRKLKKEGLVNKLGVSIYSKLECKYVLNSDIYDVIQLPVSIVDSHIYSSLIERGVEKQIVARSTFLQGTLFNRKYINKKIVQADAMLKYYATLDKLVKKYDTDLATLACSFVMSLPNVHYMIIGTTSQNNLSKIVKSSVVQLQKELYLEVKVLSKQYKEWSNPNNWCNLP